MLTTVRTLISKSSCCSKFAKEYPGRIWSRTYMTAAAANTHEHKTISVKNSLMSYIDTAHNGALAVVFLHGNPTSSYLWRNVIPQVEGLARCIAPDLIGMGRSAKIPDCKYTFLDHYGYLEEWFQKVDLPEKLNLVLHDWGSVLGFHWANQNRERVHSIIHMESLIGPIQSWDHFPEGGRKIFKAMRSDGGTSMILEKNVFVERILPSSILRKLSEDEMNMYRKPFANPGEDRRPTLTWPREIPIKGDGPEDVIAIAEQYNKWLAESIDLPKLFVNAKPGFFSQWIEDGTKNWPNHNKVTVPGLHFLQEDSPALIGQAIYAFLNEKVSLSKSDQ